MIARSTLLVLTFAFFVGGDPASAQQKDYDFYHGGNGVRSGFIVQRGAGGYERTGEREIEVRLKQGQKVCVHVVNSHPVNYAYSFNRTVDTSTVTLPDLSSQVALIAQLLRSTPQAEASPDQRTDSGQRQRAVSRVALDPIQGFTDSLGILARDVDSARAFVKKSDLPEGVQDLDRAPAELNRGFRWVQHEISNNESDRGRFNDPNLAQHLQIWWERASQAATTPSDSLTIAALALYGKSLLSDINQFKTAFARSVPFTNVVCGDVGTGPTALELKIAKKNPAAERDTGDTGFKIIARPPYDRPFISLHPIAFSSIGFNVPDFRVVNNVLRGDDGFDASFRIGGLVNFNARSFGADDVFGFGFGLGIGTQGTDEVLSDLFVGPVLSYRDEARIGLGVGASKFPRRVKDSVVGEPFTATGELDALIEEDFTLALQVIFVLPGLTLKR